MTGPSAAAGPGRRWTSTLASSEPSRSTARAPWAARSTSLRARTAAVAGICSPRAPSWRARRNAARDENSPRGAGGLLQRVTCPISSRMAVGRVGRSAIAASRIQRTNAAWTRPAGSSDSAICTDAAPAARPPVDATGAAQFCADGPGAAPWAATHSSYPGSRWWRKVARSVRSPARNRRRRRSARRCDEEGTNSGTETRSRRRVQQLMSFSGRYRTLPFRQNPSSMRAA